MNRNIMMTYSILMIQDMNKQTEKWVYGMIFDRDHNFTHIHNTTSLPPLWLLSKTFDNTYKSGIKRTRNLKIRIFFRFIPSPDYLIVMKFRYLRKRKLKKIHGSWTVNHLEKCKIHHFRLRSFILCRFGACFVFSFLSTIWLSIAFSFGISPRSKCFLL